MELRIKPEDFRWDGPMAVLDAQGHLRYRVIGDGYRLGKRIHVQDLAGREAIYIRQVIPSLFARYEIEVYGRPVGEVTRQPDGSFRGLQWSVAGDVPEDRYDLLAGQERIAFCVSGEQPGEVIMELGGGELQALGVMLLLSCVLGPLEPKKEHSTDFQD